MYIFQSPKDFKFYGVKNFTQNNTDLLTEEEIESTFQDIADCSGALFDLYCDPYDCDIIDRVMWMVRNQYCELVEVDFVPAQMYMLQEQNFKG